MIAFTDRWGRPWAARLDVDAAWRVRTLADLDVMAIAVDRSAPNRVASDPAAVASAVYAILQPQATRLGIGPTRFGRRLRGWPCWRWAVRPEALAETLLDEIDEFFRVPELSPGRPKSGPGGRQTAASLWGLVWRLAAVAGVPAGPHTLGELIAIADAKRKHDWGQTACLMGASSGAKDVASLDPTGGLKAAGRSGVTRIENTPDGAVITEY